MADALQCVACHCSLWLVMSLAVPATLAATPRPPILGVSHIAVYASDPPATERFYVHDLGATRGPDPENRLGICYYFSATQFVEVLPLPKGPPSRNRLDHIAFATSDAEGMRRYLADAGVPVPDAVVTTAEESWLQVQDPEGNRVQFVQARAASTVGLSARRFSDHIIHVHAIGKPCCSPFTAPDPAR
jgi:catechol 2,3-dioxygenase-like lactoylglutathione lyase family enzyme